MTKITGNFSSYKIELLTISPEDIRNNLLFHEEYYPKKLLDFIKNLTEEEIYCAIRTATKNYEFSEEHHMAVADTIDIFKQQHKEKQDE